MNIKSIFGILTLCMGLASCSSESEPREKDNLLMVSFTVTVDKPEQSNTRAYNGQGNAAPGANWGSNYDEDNGYPFDCTILSDNFTAILYKGTDLVGKLQNLYCTATDNGKESVSYSFRCILPDGFTPTAATYRLMVIANPPSEILTPVDFGTLTYNYIGKEQAFPAVPMWGVGSLEISEWKDGETKQFPNISLLRSMAMIRVKVADTQDFKDRGVKIKSLSLNRHNTKGYILPGEWDKIGDTNNLEFAKTLRIPDNSIGGIYTVEAKESSDEDNESKNLHFYIPEIMNSENKCTEPNFTDADADDELILKVVYIADNNEQTGYIHFCEYTSEGKPAEGAVPWDIVRNHIYEYTITGVANSDFTIKARIRKWHYEKIQFEL